MDLLNDDTLQNPEITSFANTHPEFFNRITRSIRLLPAESGGVFRHIRLTKYALCDEQGHISNIDGDFDFRLKEFHLFKVTGNLCPIFDANLAEWSINHRFDTAMEKLCGLLADYVFTSIQEHNCSSEHGNETS